MLLFAIGAVMVCFSGVSSLILRDKMEDAAHEQRIEAIWHDNVKGSDSPHLGGNSEALPAQDNGEEG